MVYVGTEMYESGADGINFDTAAAAGDAEFLATLKAIEILRKKYPQMCIMMGMAGEFILGMHGEVHYGGVRLAGLYPHKQLELAEEGWRNNLRADDQYRNQSLPSLEHRSIRQFCQSLR